MKEREWKKAADELKPKLKERKYSTEKPEKTVTLADVNPAMGDPYIWQLNT